MRFSIEKVFIFVCSAICVNTLCVGAAGADSVTYDYRGNNFAELQGDPELFSTKDRVTARFTLDCSVAHVEGTCANLPYDNYFALGAVQLESMSFSAGPASLPTAAGDAVVSAFNFSTDSNGQIVDWDIDLFLDDPSGVINVDTDNSMHGPIDSAAALGGGAIVFDDPGKWKTIGRPAKRSAPMFKDHNRTYGNDVGANVCVDFPGGQRCADLYVWENYDVKGTFQHSDLSIYYWFHRLFPEGGWRQGSRWMSCQVGPDVITAHQNYVALGAMVHPSGPECQSDGFIEECDEFHNCEWRPWGFPDPTEITGSWIDPINTSKVIVNQTDDYYDPGSGTSHKSKVHCNESGGQIMTDGGFSIDLGNAIRQFWFDGFDTQGWSHYWLRSCNNRYEEK
jgi:hypothetical protein